VSAARHDRAAWQVKLLVDHRERLVAEHTPDKQPAGLAAAPAGPDLEQATSRRPGPSQRHSTAWLAQAAQEASRSPLCQAQVAAIGSLTAQLGQFDHERCHRINPVDPEPACVAWWWDADHRQAKLIAETAGVAPVPVSSGSTDRQRLSRMATGSCMPPCTVSRSPSRACPTPPDPRPAAPRPG
jgi:hypothetical protein